MKILYGVQGTGNGHITRSRIVIPLLRSMGHEVDVIISGRKKEKYFDMETFEPYQIKHGLTFITAKGKVKIVKTRQPNLWSRSKKKASFGHRLGTLLDWCL